MRSRVRSPLRIPHFGPIGLLCQPVDPLPTARDKLKRTPETQEKNERALESIATGSSRPMLPMRTCGTLVVAGISMTDQDRRLVRQIMAKSAAVASFAAEYDLTMQLEGIGLHSRGRLYYSGKSCYRVEGITNGHRIITVSRDEVSQTYFVDLKLLSRSNRIENQSPVDLLHGLSDIRDSFSSTDGETLNFVEEALVDDRKTHHFQGQFRTLSMLGVAKVRMPIEVDLFVDQETCLLLRRVWTQTGKGTLVNAHYKVMGVDLPLDDALFSIDPPLPGIKRVDTMDISRILFSPDDRHQGASLN